MKINKVFSGKTCIVTGAASGLGLALSQALLLCGARVCLADIDTQGLQEAQSQFSDFGDNLSIISFDASAREQAAQLMDSVLGWTGRIDFLFNNAGIGGSLAIDAATNAQWQQIINLNLWSVIYCTEAVLPSMLAQGTGHIVNTASIAGLIPVPGQALYNTTKYAVVGFSESLRIELAVQGIQVSVICPGPFVSNIWGKPILGASIDTAAPAHAAPVERIVTDLLRGVAANRGIIVTPKAEKRNWRLYRYVPALVERVLRKTMLP